MSKIQILLIVGIGALGVAAAIAFGAKLLYRMAMLGMAALGVFFVAYPERTTDIAVYLGVGRGTDLLLYLSIVLGGFAILLVYVRTRRLEQKLTQHVRETAIRTARVPEEHP